MEYASLFVQPDPSWLIVPVSLHFSYETPVGNGMYVRCFSVWD
jgi:hypothetical protein